ncbi:hypothetical protein [Myxacorys almedinensis]|uniref:Uncharacterized protein n=1 Tax=Myxacorys almedinensis A TaxID=2690445 RepID=A0A8J8CIS8_9CYAN|nr:hypothetical protein [Myxacorys almedinensis]NDJ18243.1 hypothetical protein [Myxacorys almedinensis A]
MSFDLSHLFLEGNAPQHEIEPDLEVAGAIDAFTSLEEIDPTADWADVLAASWGVPCSASPIDL